MKCFILFYHIEPPIYFNAAIRTTATFSCKTRRWAGSPAVYHTVDCCYTKAMNAAC